MENYESFDTDMDEMVSKGRGNRWLYFEEMYCYIRVGPISRHGVCIQISSVSADKRYQRKGIFTRLVKHLQLRYPTHTLYLENVLDKPWMVALTERHGWLMHADFSSIWCLIKLPTPSALETSGVSDVNEIPAPSPVNQVGDRIG